MVMDSKSIISKTEGRKISLNRLNFENVSTEKLKDKGKINVVLNTSSSYKIVENSDKKLVIKINASVKFDPNVFFKIDAEYILKYFLKEKIEEEDIKSNIKELTNVVGNELSYLVSFLSKQMNNSPIIIPPALEFNSSDKATKNS